MMDRKDASLVEALAIIVGVVFAAGALLVGHMLVTGLVEGAVSLIVGAIFILSSFTAYAAWSTMRDVVYNNETARRNAIARRVGIVAATIAVVALLTAKVAL